MKILASKNGKGGAATKKVTTAKQTSDIRLITTVDTEGKQLHNLNFSGAWKKLDLANHGIIFMVEETPTLVVLADTHPAVMSFGKTKKSENAKSKFVKADNFTNILAKAGLISGEEITSSQKITNYLSLEKIANEPIEGLDLEDSEYTTYQVVAATKEVEGGEDSQVIPYSVETIKTPSAETVSKIMASRNAKKNQAGTFSGESESEDQN